MKLITFLFTLLAINSYASNFEGTYQGISEKDEDCIVDVRYIESTDSYKISFYEDTEFIIDVSLYANSLNEELERNHYYERDFVVDGFFGKKLYEIFISNDNDLLKFKVIRWRFLTGSGWATPFYKASCQETK